MKTVVPDYYGDFRCSMGACRHTCCAEWEIDIDDVSLRRFEKEPFIRERISLEGTPHMELREGAVCPFLNADGLCEMYIRYGEDMLCDICRDHPRFRSFWSDRTEIGLGLACEECAKLILGAEKPMKLVTVADDGENEPLTEDEEWLLSYRQDLIDGISFGGPAARLLEYLYFRHIPDALYDGRVNERTEFCHRSFEEITDAWEETDGSLEAMSEAARAFSYDIEYDDEAFEKMLSECGKQK